MEKKKVAQFKESNIADPLIYIGEVFSRIVELNEKFEMDIHDYRMLQCAAC